MGKKSDRDGSNSIRTISDTRPCQWWQGQEMNRDYRQEESE